MAQTTDNFNSILSRIKPVLTDAGFDRVDYQQSDTGFSAYYAGDRGALRIDWADGKITLFGSRVEYDTAQEGDYKKLTTSLLSDESSESDMKYVADDFIETIEAKFSEKSKALAKSSGGKSFQTVSKAAAKSGVAYDTTTLGSRICLVFPELRAEYKANISQYGEFLGEEFFVKHGTPVIIDEIKRNNPAVMKKLFAVLNEMYDDGTNEVQGMIAVTILGELNNDTILLANCVDYMSKTMAPTVIEINRYLSTRSGHKARQKMENPPPYKPKKKKKGGGLMQMLMGGGQAPGM